MHRPRTTLPKRPPYGHRSSSLYRIMSATESLLRRRPGSSLQRRASAAAPARSAMTCLPAETILSPREASTTPDCDLTGAQGTRCADHGRLVLARQVHLQGRNLVCHTTCNHRTERRTWRSSCDWTSSHRDLQPVAGNRRRRCPALVPLPDAHRPEPRDDVHELGYADKDPDAPFRPRAERRKRALLHPALPASDTELT